MTKEERTRNFMADRFGMFIHWGLYAIPARGEWVKSQERIPDAEYQKYFEAFDPVDYDPEKWAALAKAAGMKYAVLTTKHHDGFCLFDSALTDYKATNTRAGRDLVREFVDAFRAQGIKVGFYYSLLDWHHPDYPVYHDRQHPMRDNEAFRDAAKTQDFSRYVEYFHGQVRELLSNYGKIDIMWFDFSYKDEVNDMSGEKWQASRLVRMIRQLQPDIVLDNRLKIHHTNGKTLVYGDFLSPEQILPRRGLTAPDGSPLPWEACITLNNHWGYCADDHDYKQPADVVRALVECVSKNGNLILNVGPDARGRIPEESREILLRVGKWLEKNGRSIYGCRAAEMEKPEWGRYTCNGKHLYAHILERGIGPVNLEGLGGRAKRASYLHDGAEINTSTPWNAEEGRNDVYLNLGTYRLPDPLDTVVDLELR